ncbi:alcohol dehydrogenase [Emericellopsis cladophorae]|uniref:Alcohol dehydrogenase n=1 Tax=Emericellopsis cladophorae TaxID=2686198 RepID=A0A9P9Y1C7_9HYPO|nr:alcohol dehydrogenase [Emericellopsis cladophorae]KAI6781305.1 alcohol dehydrogenase [Emericellopsis cladophorae]
MTSTLSSPSTTATPRLALSTEDTGVTVPSVSTSSSRKCSDGRSRSGCSPRSPSCSAATASPKVVFGAGAISRLPTELGSLRLNAPLVVSSPSRISLARKVQSLIPNLDSRILDAALVNVPQKVVDDAVARISGRDSVISVGGGSAVALAISISQKKGIPHICIPTTYSGSEMPLAGDSRRRSFEGRRTRGSSSVGRVHSGRPTIIIYDEDLTNTGTTMTFTAPSEAHVDLRQQSEDDSNWSYLHLAGV